MGVEPTTCRLRIGCSTTELPRLISNLRYNCTKTQHISIEPHSFAASTPFACSSAAMALLMSSSATMA